MSSPRLNHENDAVLARWYGLDSASERNSELPVVIPSAGIFNFGHGPISTAAAHFYLFRRMLQKAGLTVEQPMLPHNLGIVGNMERDYRSFRDHVDRILDQKKYGPDARALIIGHSFGGLFGTRAYATQDGSHEVSGVITLGSPHGDLRDFPFPKRLRHLNPYLHRCDEIAEFSQETRSMLPQRVGADALLFAGSTFDEWVPLVGSIPETPRAERVIFSNTGHTPPEFDGVETITTPVMAHNLLLLHPTVKAYVSSKILDMVEVKQPASAITPQFALASR